MVEIGTGNRDVLNYPISDLSEINHFIVINIRLGQIEINNKKFRNNKGWSLCRQMLMIDLKTIDRAIIFSPISRCFKIFPRASTARTFTRNKPIIKIIFIAIEPNNAAHDFETQPNTYLYGNEPSFLHNYPGLFKNAGFSVCHFSQKTWHKASDM